MKFSIFTRLGAACAGTLVTAGLAAAPALATPSIGQRGARPAAAPLANPVSPAAATQTEYLGGFSAEPAGGPGSISATFTIPKATCASKTDYEDVFLGEQLVPDTGNTFEGGVTDAAADVIMYCPDNGKVLDYIEAYTVNGGDNDEQVKPGDKVQTRIAQLPNGETYATATDLTHYAQEASSGASTGDDVAFFAGVIPNLFYEEQSSDLYIPKFKMVKFSDSQINGFDFNEADPQGSPYSLDQTGTVQVTPGTLAAETKPSPNWSVTEKSPF
jgi:hypothetical protein